jgi:hypothetical protein
MNARELGSALSAADPVDRERLRRLDLEAMEADLLADLEDGFPLLSERATGRPRHPARRLVLGFGAAALAAVVALVLVFSGGGSTGTSPAYGAELVRFAESTPLLLLEGPGWRVEDVSGSKTRAGNSGQMEFITGKPIPYGTTRSTGNVETGQYVSGLAPATVRQRKVQLEWRTEPFSQAVEYLRGRLAPHGPHFIKLPVLGTTALVDTRAEIYVNQGGPGDREMIAIWSEDGNVVTLQAAVPNLAAMEERLGWMTKVDSQTWLEALPAKAVAAADLQNTDREMLKGVPLPRTFALSRIPDEGLTTNRDQVSYTVTGTVACLWFRQWGEAQRSGDTAAEVEAEKALASSKDWPVLREREDGHADRSAIYEDAMEMPQGYWDFRGHHRDLLAHAESIGCARLGLPLLPEKMKRQREQGVPPPPD